MHFRKFSAHPESCSYIWSTNHMDLTPKPQFVTTTFFCSSVLILRNLPEVESIWRHLWYAVFLEGLYYHCNLMLLYRPTCQLFNVNFLLLTGLFCFVNVNIFEGRFCIQKRLFRGWVKSIFELLDVKFENLALL